MYSLQVLDHFHQPRNVGPLEAATHQATVGVPGDGPYLILWFRVEQGTIVQAAYQTYGCPAAVASGSLLAELAVGRSPKTLLSLTPREVMLLLGGLPEGKEACAERAIQALHGALQGTQKK
jgi:nitrogen fixation NifU-like protein